jgi:hypothetical protein
MTSAPVQLDEESIVREFIGQMKLPPGVSFARIEEGTMWEGEPAFRIYFNVSVKYGYGRKRIQALSDMKRKIKRMVFDAKLVRWPFVHLLEVK